MLTFNDAMEHALRMHASRTAVIDGSVQLCYRDWVLRSRRLGSALRASGLRQGDRVAILANNGHRYLEAFFGLPAAGLVVVPLNTRLSTPELRTIAQDCGARVLLTDRDASGIANGFERVIALPDEYEALIERAAPETPSAAIEETALAALFYTGGTTGLPKGVMLSHRNIVANAFQKALACSLTADDCFLAAPAMFHVAGIAPLLSLVWLGGRIVTLPSFDAERCLDMVEEHGVTVFMPVPTMLAAVVAAQSERPRNVNTLQLLGHAGSHIANEGIEAAHRAFPDAELAQFYGATETASLVTCQRHEEQLIGTPLLGTCGRAALGLTVRTLREDGTECDPGEVGEIVVRGASVTIGYFRQPELTAAALRGGYYHTGDLGLLDADHQLFVVDRKKDMIISGGENVYSAEVENALHRHPAIIEAAVFGVPDEKWGEAVEAVVVVDRVHIADALPEELRRHCRQHIAGYKVPKHIEVRTEPLPKSGPGKVLKRVLREARQAQLSEER